MKLGHSCAPGQASFKLMRNGHTWTKPKPLIKLGYPSRPQLFTSKGMVVGSVYAVTDYATGKTLYFTLKTFTQNKKSIDLHFASFEQLMMHADLHNIVVDTYGWEKYGITRCYDNHSIGDKMKFSDGREEVLVGLDD